VDRVVIGVDPHKKSVTFEARDSREILRATGSFPTDTSGYRLLMRYAAQWPDRIWAGGRERDRPSAGAAAAGRRRAGAGCAGQAGRPGAGAPAPGRAARPIRRMRTRS